MSRIGTSAVRVTAAAAAMACLGLSAPAIPTAPAGPCALSLSLICHFVPIEPDLDEDIDLTQPKPQNPVGTADPGIALAGG